MPAMSTSNPGRRFKALIVIVFATVVSLLAVEAALHILKATGKFDRQLAIFGDPRPPLDTRTGSGMYYAHQYSAYALKPGYTRAPRERINSLGFRGEEISKLKPDGVYRIVVTGGSTTFDVYLPWNESFPFHLQKVLRKRLGTDRIEVINAGLNGATAAETFHRLPTLILPINPDMVIMYEGFNDMLPRVFNDYQDDYYHFRRSDPNNPPGLSRFFLYRLAMRVLSPSFFHENYNLARQVWKTQNIPETDTELAQNFLSSNNDAFKFNMDNSIRLLKSWNIKVVLATFAMAPDIWHWQEIIPPYMWEIGIAENNDSIRALAKQHSLTLVPFAEAPFERGAADLQSQMFDDSIHNSIAGNQFKAEIFADSVAPLIATKLGLAVPSPSPYAATAAAAPETALTQQAN